MLDRRTSEGVVRVGAALLLVAALTGCIVVPAADRGAGPGSGEGQGSGEGGLSGSLQQAGSHFVAWVDRKLGWGDAGRQDRTIADMRRTGGALMSWLTDQVGAAAAGRATREAMDLSGLPVVGAEQLEAILVPSHIPYIPKLDGWGNPYEYRVIPELRRGPLVSIRSAGSDGAFEGEIFESGPFPDTEFDRDLVWADGMFVRWPKE